MRKTFNPLEWMENPNQQKQQKEQNLQTLTDSNTDVEKIIQNIEGKQVDIAPNYKDWISIGFAFADEFGESGRNLFHRVSQFYPDYNYEQCNKQYDNCLRSKGTGVSLKSFFFLAKKAGVSIATPYYNNDKSKSLSDAETQDESHQRDEMPTFPKSMYANLPEFLKEVVAVATSDEERDILLLGAIVSISARSEERRVGKE